MTTDSQYRTNAPTVISEIIDNEVIIINLDSGAYYSLRDTGAAVWQLIQNGATLQQVIEQMCLNWDGAEQDIVDGVNQLLAELLQEKLLLPAEALPPTVNPLPANLTEKAIFRKPVLEKFTNMSDLLLLDPIHEVDDSGWPKPKTP